MWQETGSVLGKQSWLWGMRDHKQMILGVRWVLQFAMETWLFSLYLSWSYHCCCSRSWPYVFLQGWLVSLIVTEGKCHSPWLLKEKVSAWAVELCGLGNGTPHLYPCQLASFPLLLFSAVPQIHKAHRPVHCPTGSRAWHEPSSCNHGLEGLEGVKPAGHWGALMELWVPMPNSCPLLGGPLDWWWHSRKGWWKDKQAQCLLQSCTEEGWKGPWGPSNFPVH